MFAELAATLYGLLTLTLLVVSLLFYFVPFLVFALIKLLPVPPLQKLMTAAVSRVATGWFGFLNRMFRALRITHWHLSGTEHLSRDHTYLVISNHQTWADILVLLYAINGRTPPFRFFLKREILYMPVIGFVCWAMDMPFMKRHSREVLERDPQRRDEDFRAARRATAKYRTQKVTIVNYAEGTRMRRDKHIAQQSPYRHLLRPKAGGVGMVLGSMGDQVEAILDVTIAYAGGGGFWRFMSGRVPHIYVHIETLAVPADFVGRDYLTDEQYQQALRAWVNALWASKDERMTALLGEAVPIPGNP